MVALNDNLQMRPIRWCDGQRDALDAVGIAVTVIFPLLSCAAADNMVSTYCN